MSSLVEFAESELGYLLKDCKDSESLKMQKAVNDDILEVVKTFSKQGHSGFSAKYCLNILTRLLDYKPLSAIEDNENEWTKLDYNDDIVYQCKRCPSLFKNKDGKVYNVEAKVFSDDNGHTWYTGRGSSAFVELPYYVPIRPEYVIINNQQERQNIMTNICNIILALGGKKFLVADITEDTLLDDLLDESKFEDLEKHLIDTYHITKPLFSLKDDVHKMWEVINFVMKSESEEQEKQDE